MGNKTEIFEKEDPDKVYDKPLPKIFLNKLQTIQPTDFLQNIKLFEQYITNIEVHDEFITKIIKNKYGKILVLIDFINGNVVKIQTRQYYDNIINVFVLTEVKYDMFNNLSEITIKIPHNIYKQNNTSHTIDCLLHKNYYLDRENISRSFKIIKTSNEQNKLNAIIVNDGRFYYGPYFVNSWNDMTINIAKRFTIFTSDENEYQKTIMEDKYYQFFAVKLMLFSNNVLINDVECYTCLNNRSNLFNILCVKNEKKYDNTILLSDSSQKYDFILDKFIYTF